MATNWLSVMGKAEITDEQIKYVPIPITEGPNAGLNSVAMLRSNIEFGGGEISCEAFFSHPNSACQIVINQAPSPDIFGGVILAPSPYGIAIFVNQGWEFLAAVGQGDGHPINKWTSIKVRVVGSKIVSN